MPFSAIVMGDTLVFVDGIEKRSGKLRRIRIPLPIDNIENNCASNTLIGRQPNSRAEIPHILLC